MALLVKMLGDMRSRNLPIFQATSNAISTYVIESVSPHSQNDRDVGHLIALCRHMMTAIFPLAAKAMHIILLRLGREQQLQALETLSLEVVRRYRDINRSTRAALNVHRLDVPEALMTDSPHDSFLSLPRDLKLSHHLHPIQTIFDKKLQHSIVRWGFAFGASPQHRLDDVALAGLTKPREPADFGLARGVRLLALLREKGLVVNQVALTKAIQLRMADLYTADWYSNYRLLKRARQNQLTLEEVKLICDEAWGSELLPSLPELEENVKKYGLKRTERWSTYMATRDSPDHR
jgi:hypothetical protein